MSNVQYHTLESCVDDLDCRFPVTLRDFAVLRLCNRNIRSLRLLPTGSTASCRWKVLILCSVLRVVNLVVHLFLCEYSEYMYGGAQAGEPAVFALNCVGVPLGEI